MRRRVSLRDTTWWSLQVKKATDPFATNNQSYGPYPPKKTALQVVAFNTDPTSSLTNFAILPTIMKSFDPIITGIGIPILSKFLLLTGPERSKQLELNAEPEFDFVTLKVMEGVIPKTFEPGPHPVQLFSQLHMDLMLYYRATEPDLEILRENEVEFYFWLSKRCIFDPRLTLKMR